eukprot:scaffold1629_cov369-Prasinococcus_capsulatus_cf.AAC.8
MSGTLVVSAGVAPALRFGPGPPWPGVGVVFSKRETDFRGAPRPLDERKITTTRRLALSPSASCRCTPTPRSAL